MKNFLSLIGAFVLSFSLFAGCGADASDLENATKDLMVTINAINQNKDKLDEAAEKEFNEIKEKDAMELSTISTSNSSLDDAYDRVTDLNEKLKNIAEKSGIEIK